MVGLLIALGVLAWFTAVAAVRGESGLLFFFAWCWLVGLVTLYETWRRGRKGRSRR